MSTYDVEALRASFPSLRSGIAHFDGPGGTQTPQAVGDAVTRTLIGPLSNRGHGLDSESNAEAAVTAFRDAYADFLGVARDGVIYGRSATQLTYDFSRHLAKSWRRGDEVVVSRLDHDANVRPWIQAAEHIGATVRWIDIEPATAEIDESSVDRAISSRTRLVAIAAASNLLGTMPPLRTIADAAHAVGALVYVDGVHFAAHQLVDIGALGADFFVCSPYKFLGPHCGVLGASPELLETVVPDKLLPATNVVPERFEFGTLPYELMAGATAAVEFIASIAPGEGFTRRGRLASSMLAIDNHELELRSRAERGLAELDSRIDIHSRAARRTPTLLVTVEGRRMRDACEFLAGQRILAPAGSFYAYEPFRRLALADDHALRIGIAPYNTDAEIDRLVDALAKFLGHA